MNIFYDGEVDYSMKVQRQEEFQISESVQKDIRQLMESCFSNYPGDRIYLKQLPDFRYLIWEGRQLIAHMAVEHRMVNNQGEPFRIFGITDLCVAADFQHQKHASHLLRLLEDLAKQNGIDFIILNAVEHQLYQNNGYQLVENTCTWLLIQSHKTIGVVRRRLSQSLMVKALGDKEWKAGDLDFLGYAF